MAGSIVTRNRNVLVRASVPAAVGVAAAWLLLPATTRNVADLVWTYEERVPGVAEGHVRVREVLEGAWRGVEEGVGSVRVLVQDGVRVGREAVEGWVGSGK